MTRTCTKCLGEFPEDADHFHRHGLGFESRCKWCVRAYKSVSARELRMTALVHYSADPPFCGCCFESTYEFLSIDHVAGGGNRHRKREKNAKIGAILKRDGYPLGYRVLCFNCNAATAIYGACPHERQRCVEQEVV